MFDFPEQGMTVIPRPSKSHIFDLAKPRIAARSSSPSTNTTTSAKNPSPIQGVIMDWRRGLSVSAVNFSLCLSLASHSSLATASISGLSSIE